MWSTRRAPRHCCKCIRRLQMGPQGLGLGLKLELKGLIPAPCLRPRFPSQAISRLHLSKFQVETRENHRALLLRPPPTPTTPPDSTNNTIKMADRGGFASRGGAERGGDRGRGRGGRRGPRRGAKSEEKEWQPVTKLGRLVKAGKIKSMEEIYLHSLPIKEYQIVDFFLPSLKDEVMKVRFCPQSTNERNNAERHTDEIAQNRSSPSRSRPVPVSVPASRLSSSSVTPTATSASVSRPPRKSLPPSAPPSSSPSSTSSPSVADTGAPTLVSLTPFPSRSLASAVPSPSV
jgi:hypothetical protein